MTVPILPDIPADYAADATVPATDMNAVLANLRYAVTPTRPLVIVRVTGTVNVTSSAGMNVPFDEAVMDTAGMWDSLTPTVITVRDGGVWVWVAQVTFPANSTGIRGVYLTKNGDSGLSNGFAAQEADASSSTAGTFLQILGTTRFDDGDVVKLRVFQSSGSTLALRTDYGSTYVAGLWWMP